MKTIPVQQFGKDHYSLLAYLGLDMPKISAELYAQFKRETK